MFNLDNLVRTNVKSLVPYSCARDEFEGKEGIFLDANENPFGNLNRYPDPYQKELKYRISKVKGVPYEKIFLGNGSDEIIDLAFRIFCTPGTDRALTFTPTYGMYEVSASVNDVKMIKVPLDQFFQIDYEATAPLLKDDTLKLIMVCSPNNPTGNTMNRLTLEKIMENFKGIVLIDEAYIDFSEEKSLTEWIDKYPNLIIMQTFSKAYGMASVRVGMAFASVQVIRYFNKMKPPYNISTINQLAILKKLGKPELYQSQVNKIKDERERLSRELGIFPFVEKIFPSDANFILVKVKEATKIYNYLINRGIIVRNRSSVIDNCLRITVGTKNENNKLLKALTLFEL